MRTVVLLLPLLLMSVGCKKKAPKATTEPTTSMTTPKETSTGVTQETVDTMMGHFSKVLFEFDSDALVQGSMDALAENAKIMQKHPTIAIEIQGHSDERGSADYNLALGDRRASAIAKYMTQMGIPATRVKVVSYGEEAPERKESNEWAYSQNRRAEFRILRGDGDVKGTTP